VGYGKNVGLEDVADCPSIPGICQQIKYLQVICRIFAYKRSARVCVARDVLLPDCVTYQGFAVGSVGDFGGPIERISDRIGQGSLWRPFLTAALSRRKTYCKGSGMR